jgi:hypothetical protein
MALNTIKPLTVANGGLVRVNTLSEEGKELVLEQMHSKFLGHQIMELLQLQPIKQLNSMQIYTCGSARMDAKKKWTA